MVLKDYYFYQTPKVKVTASEMMIHINSSRHKNQLTRSIITKPSINRTLLLKKLFKAIYCYTSNETEAVKYHRGTFGIVRK